MLDHPTIKLCDNSWYRTRDALIVARNVIAIADTGAQANVWSLRNFLAAGFYRSILIPASDLVAANRSGIKIEGAFFAAIKGLSADKVNVQCHAMIYVTVNVSTLYLSRATLSDQGVLFPQFPLIGEYPPLNTHKQNSTTKAFCASILSASGGCSLLSPVNLLTLVLAPSGPLYRRLLHHYHFRAYLRTMPKC